MRLHCSVLRIARGPSASLSKALLRWVRTFPINWYGTRLETSPDYSSTRCRHVFGGVPGVFKANESVQSMNPINYQSNRSPEEHARETHLESFCHLLDITRLLLPVHFLAA